MKFKWIFMMISVVIIISGCSDGVSPAEDCQASEVSNEENERNENYMNNDKFVQQNSLPPLDQEIPRELETATLAMGWFWGPDARFGQVEGVYRTRVGYAGGSTENPTYENLGDHIETLQVDYDPSKISYADILDIFWNEHDPTAKAWSRQYMAALFYHNEDQKIAALQSKKEVEQKLRKEVKTEIMPLEKFYLAENYHQKYYLKRQAALVSDLKAYYPGPEQLTDSTVAARLNGIAGGFGDTKLLEKEIERYGLSPETREILEFAVY